MTNKNMDRVNLVDENDQIIADCDKFEAHLGEGLLHQAVSFFLFYKKKDGSVKLLIQQRSEKKIVGALEWGNTLCGNVRPKESHAECVLRRAKEELGIEWKQQWGLDEVYVLRYQVKCNEKYSENEIDHIFVTVLDKENYDGFQVKENPDEVNSSTWVDWQELKENKKIEGKVLVPWLKIFLDNQELIKKIEEKI